MEQNDAVWNGGINLDRYACITGADRGLGFELAKMLLKDGYIVFAGKYDRRWSLLDDLHAAYPDRLEILDLDVSDDSSVRNAAAQISSRTGSLDVLINNSAILGDIRSTIFDPLDFDEIQKVFNTNALGALRVTNALIRLLADGEKKLIMNISSEAGSIGTCWRDSWFAYCMSKAAVNMQSNLVHNSIAKIGGLVIVIHPGWMKSWLSGEYHDEAPLTPDIPAGRLMEIIRGSERYRGEKPVYIDYLGEKIEW